MKFYVTGLYNVSLRHGSKYVIIALPFFVHLSGGWLPPSSARVAAFQPCLQGATTSTGAGSFPVLSDCWSTTVFFGQPWLLCGGSVLAVGCPLSLVGWMFEEVWYVVPSSTLSLSFWAWLVLLGWGFHRLVPALALQVLFKQVAMRTQYRWVNVESSLWNRWLFVRWDVAKLLMCPSAGII